MKAMRLHGTAPIAERPLVMETVASPVPGQGELRLDVRVCGVCRTDLHVIEGELPSRRLPLIPGHQIVGTVESLGPGSGRFRVGDRVGVAWLRETCGACPDCTTGRENLCAKSRYTGYHADGGYAESCVVREDWAYLIPNEMSDLQAAPLLCAGIIGYRALSRANVPRGGRLGLFGFGSSAHIVLQIARHRGLEVFVTTRGANHQALARTLGASWAGDSLEPLPVPLDSAIVFAPAGEIVPRALRAIRPGGTVALAGIYMTPIPEMDYEPHLFHEKTLTSVEANTRADGEMLLREAAAASVTAEITSYPLHAANDALIDLKQGRVNGTAVLVC